MKKLSLLFVGLLLTAVSAIAQPAKPEVKYTSFAEAIEASIEEPVYFYNTEAGLFLTGGMWWGARACLADNGNGAGNGGNWYNYDDFLLGKANVKGEKWTIHHEETNIRDGKPCYAFLNQTRTNVYLSNDKLDVGNEVWVDDGDVGKRPNYNGWYVEDLGNNTFRIGYISATTKGEGESATTTYTNHGWLGAQKLNTEKDLNLFVIEGTANTTWAIVSEKEYQRVLPLLQVYYVADNLNNIVSVVKEYSLMADVSKYEALLNKSDVTFDEIKTAFDDFNALFPAINFGKAIDKAKKADAERDWSKYETICGDPTSTEAIFTTNTNLINAFIALKEALNEAKTLDAQKTYTASVNIYNNDNLALDDVNAETKRVNAYISLKKALNTAVEKGCNVTDYNAVYAKDDATEEELAAAEAKVQELITIAEINGTVAGATAANPVDLTQYIVNPSFDKKGDFTGWTGDEIKVGDEVKVVVFAVCWKAEDQATNAEVYGAQFNVHQDIKNLPEGIYMLACNGYLRLNNDVADDYKAWKAGQASETKMYLEGATNGQYFTPVKFISAGGSDKSLGQDEKSTKATDENGEEYTLYTPNTMKAADYYFHETDDPNRYRNEAYGPLAAGDVLRIGVKNDKAEGNSWSIFDDFQLFYLGNGEDAYKKWAESVKDNNAINFDGEVYYGTPEKDAYDEVIAELTSAGTKEAVSEAILKMDAAVDAVDASKKNYAAYVAALENVRQWLDNNSGASDDYYKLLDYMEAEEQIEDWEWPNGPAKVIIPDYLQGGYAGILSAADIATETKYVEAMLEAATSSSLTDGSDLTHMITNPNFEEKDGKGWSTDTSNGGDANINSWRGGKAENYCAEAFERNFDVYQEIGTDEKPLPDGFYEVSVQSFYRTGWNKSAWDAYQADPKMEGEAKVLSEVYLNDFAAPVKNVMEIQFDTNLETNCYSPADDASNGDAKTAPFTLNGMNSASAAFSLTDPAKNFTVSTYAWVTGGKIRLGIRNLTGSNGGRWTVWDNFKLIYREKNAEVATVVLKNKAKEMNDLKDNSDIISKVEDEATSINEQAQGKSLTVDQKCALIVQANDMIATIKENVKAVEEFKKSKLGYDAACGKLDEVAPYNDYEEDDLPEIWKKVDNMDDDLKNNPYRSLESTEDLNKVTDDLEKLTEEISEAIALIKADEMLQELAKATDDNPVEITKYLVNPDFEDETLNQETGEKQLGGWNCYIGYDTHIVKNEGNTSINDERCKNYLFNTWNWEGKSPEDFWLSQTIKCLVAGTYKLTAILASDPGNVITLSANDDAADFTMEGDNKTANKAEFIFKIEGKSASESNIRKAETDLFDVEIKASSKSWFKADCFTLTYYGAESKLIPTEIEEIDAQPVKVKNGKFIENGQIIIIRDGKKYNAMGVLLQ